MKRLLTATLAGATLFIALPAAADRYPWNEAENHVVRARDVQSLGTDLFGDQVNLQDGTLSFSVTDIDIPGNSALPVRFARTFSLFNREDQPTEEMLGDWELEVPQISGVFAPNWVGQDGTVNRCSSAGAPPPAAPPHSSIEPSATAYSYWQGIDIKIPGVSSGELMVNLGGGTQPPGGPYPWVTNDHVRVSCLPTIKNGSGQGFLAVAPDGTKYWFDWMAQYVLPPSKQVSGPFDVYSGLGHEWYIVRMRNVLYATRVEDRFGNWVTYTYNNAWGYPGRLTEINSNDGRRITVAYAGQAISSVTATSSDSAPRTWTYAVGLTPAGRRTLTSVTLPDATHWQLAFSQFTDAEIKYLKYYMPGEVYRTCTGLEDPQNAFVTPTATVTHPSGAVGTFTTAIQEHGRTNVPLSCANVQIPVGGTILGDNPNDDVNLFPVSFHQFSLTKKQISGPGVTPGEWNYSYQPNISVFMHPGTTWDFPFCFGAHCHQPPVCSGGPCPGSTKTVVTSPTGQWARYTYGNSFKHNEGKLLQVEVGTDPTNILYSEVHDYDFVRSGRSYPMRLGQSLKFVGGTTDYYRPQTKVIKTQQGVSFSWQVADCGSPSEPCFDGFVRPKLVVKSSTLPGSPSRREQTTYSDNLTRWVLGQVSEVRCMQSNPVSAACNGGTGSIMSQTTYDPTWALPLVSKQFNRTVQTLTYDTTASVASGQLGTVKTVADGNGNVTTASNWKRGIPRSIKFPGTPEAPTGATRTAGVNDHGWVTSVTDENGFSTGYGYDLMGRVTLVDYPDGDVVNWTDTTASFARSSTAKYGLPIGHWQQTVSTGAARKITYFDALWRPVVTESFDNTNSATANATRSLSVQRYDAAGRSIFQSFPMSSLVSYGAAALTGTHNTYDALDRVTRVEQDWEGIGRLITGTEYLAGFKTRVTPPRGQGAGSTFQTTTDYLAWDHPTTEMPVSIAHPAGAFTDIARDAFGKPTSIVRRNASGSTSLARHYVYDAGQLLCKAVEPETGATIMAYDAAGNLAWSKSGATQTGLGACNTADIPAGQRTVRTYDARNRLQSLSFPDGRGNQSWSYTRDGLPAGISTNNSSSDNIVTNTYGYNRRRLIEGETFQVGSQLWSLDYNYNALGHLSDYATPGLLVDLAPNALGQPTKAGTYASAVAYHPNGAVKQFTYGNGIKRTLTQNARGLPETSCDFAGSSCTASAVLRDVYDYDPHGNVAAITDGRTGSRGNRDMVYDALDRLMQTVSPMFGTASYTYDVLDNLRTVQVTGGPRVRNHTYVYDTSNRMTNVTNTVGGATVVGLGYDAQGNLANKNGVLHAFDLGNRLREVTGVEQYLYDGHGRRVLAIRNGQNLYSLYGQDGVLRFQRDERTGKTIDYVHLGGSLVAQVESAIALSTPALSAPGSSSTGSYTVSWTASPLASKYQLQERLGSGGWTTIHDAAGTSKAITGKAAGSWGYQVRACSATTCGNWSAVVTVAVQLPPTAAPTLTVPLTGLNGSFTVGWTTVAAADRYQLQERLGTGSWSTVHDAAGTSKAISGKAAGSWGYQVRGCNNAGCGPWSSIGTVQVIHVPGSAPTLTVPATNLTGGYTVSWTSIATATRYELEERLGTGTWAQIHNASGTSRAISGKTTGSWGYRVRACNDAGCSAWSSVATVAVTRPPTSAPTLTVPANNTTGSYTVSWSGVTHATSYQLQERLGTGSWSTIQDASGTSRATSGKSTGNWSYQVSACNAAGCGSWSSVAQITVVTSPPATPVLTLNWTSNTTFTAYWSAVPFASNYQLQQQLNNGVWVLDWEGSATSRMYVKPHGIYRYQLRACNVAGCSAWTATNTIVLAPPGGGGPGDPPPCTEPPCSIEP